MPYLTKTNKELIDMGDPVRTPGDLNYAITRLLKAYIEFNGTTYRALNDVTGALENSKLEFYRRVIVPYEEDKIKKNGDVY